MDNLEILDELIDDSSLSLEIVKKTTIFDTISAINIQEDEKIDLSSNRIGLLEYDLVKSIDLFIILCRQGKRDEKLLAKIIKWIRIYRYNLFMENPIIYQVWHPFINDLHVLLRDQSNNTLETFIECFNKFNENYP